MKLKTIGKYIGIASIMMLGTSCSKYLNLEPENSTYDAVFWKDGSNVNRAKLGAYSLLRDALRDGRSFFIFGDLAAGNFQVGSDYWNYASLIKSGGFRFSYAPYLEGSLWNWTRFYKIINQCNLIIEHTEEMNSSLFDGGDAEKTQAIAEARFLRAYTFFYMQRVWGDVLLTKKVFSDPQNIPDMARTPEKETLDFCTEDLKYAVDNLDEGITKRFASKAAAQALLAHLYAWRHDYANAEKMATAVIQGNFDLVDIKDYKSIWAGDSEETIFELPMTYSDSGNEFSKDFFNAFLADPTIKGKGINSAWTIDLDLLNISFRVQDPIVQDKRPAAVFRKVSTNVWLLQKYDVIKRYDDDESHYAVSNNLVLLRLADIYLLRAEAYAKTGRESLALDDLNRIRERAGLSAISVSGTGLIEEVFNERRRELIGEGSTQFDLIRMGLLNVLPEYSGYYTADRVANQGYYWPLNMRDLLPQNEMLTQNPWWKNH
ncbi:MULTISPECIES: RagB/SusD family nutrient uptake outer membrane protein [Sphingobacterium]|uniref:RagB/SusD family nutrient uptake outer membrane protein n=1 Tax=Sphingobacterium TaxID=28453 RepID=UPI00257B3B53|nr:MULTISPECIES: RagB/SusD family nutrient uptake outer membrane protein [Sphingobacterium]